MLGDTNMGIAQELGKSLDYVHKVRHVIRKELREKLITVADFLNTGMRFPELELSPHSLPSGARDAFSGLEISTGYDVWEIIPDNTGEFLDLLKGGKFLSESSARCFKGSWNLGSVLIFDDGSAYRPLIARDPKNDRPCWSELVRQVWPERKDQNCLMIITTDFKKRVWPRARIGPLGQQTPVYLHNPEANLSNHFCFNWEKMITDLDIIEGVYELGFVKQSIKTSLLMQYKLAIEIGLKRAIELDSELNQIRNKPEFTIALLISQRKEKKNEIQTEQPELF